MAKTNVRSFRFDDEVLKIIEGFEGDNCSDKFDRIVRHCFMAVPEAQRQLDDLETQIKNKKKELKRICDMSDEMRTIQSKVMNLSLNLTNLNNETLETFIKFKD